MIDAKEDETMAAEDRPRKTPKQLQKEAKKLAKLEKFKQKQEKRVTEQPANAKEKPEVGPCPALNSPRERNTEDTGVLIVHMESNRSLSGIIKSNLF